MYHLYNSHHGDFYICAKKKTEKQLFCEICNDHDEYIGSFSNKGELVNILKKKRPWLDLDKANFYQTVENIMVMTKKIEKAKAI
jgi:hypothetical protein